MGAALPEAFLSFGSNYPDAPERIVKAQALIQSLGNLYFSDFSPLFLTEPQEKKDQPWFHNSVARICLHKGWSAGKFLQALLEIEKKLERKRDAKNRYGPRPIDLDLLLFDDLKSDIAECVLPHPRMHQRAFVLVPLLVIAPNIIVKGKNLNYWLSRLNWHIHGWKIWQEQSLQKG